MINQMEVHIFNQQKQFKEYADKYNAQLEAWRHLERDAKEIFK